MSRNPHEPTPETRKQVYSLAACGTRQCDIALLLGISEKTLRLYYRLELDEGEADLIAAVIGKLLEMINAGSRSHAFFYQKCWGGEKPHAKELAQQADVMAEREMREKEAREKKANEDFEYKTKGCNTAKCAEAVVQWIKYATAFNIPRNRDEWSEYLKKLLAQIEQAKREVENAG